MIAAVVERCAGIDVGKKFVMVCVMTGAAHEEPRAETRKFSTVRGELVKMREWLQAEGCTHVVMESTGCYWKPVLNVLEDDADYRVAVVLANAQQVKGLAGHKTDPRDARWLAHLLRHGMVRPSFIPERAVRDLRELTRLRRRFIGAGAQERNRVQKVLEDANVKIGDVLSDVFGVSGQLMLEAMVKGCTDPVAIAELALGVARKKIGQLEAALEGHQMRSPHRMLIGHSMRHMAFLAQEVDQLDEEIAGLIGEAGLSPQYELLQTIPGIQKTAAAAMLAECGGDMQQFRQPRRFCCWSGVAPGNRESAGIRRRAPATPGNPNMKAALVESGWSAARTKDTEFEDRYHHLKVRLGHKRAIVATAHSLALTVFEVLRSGQPYTPRQPHFKARDIARLRRHHSRRLRTIGRWLEQQPFS